MHKILLPIEDDDGASRFARSQGEAPLVGINEFMPFAKSFRQPTIYNEQAHFNLDRVASAIPPTEGQSCSDG